MRDVVAGVVTDAMRPGGRCLTVEPSPLEAIVWGRVVRRCTAQASVCASVAAARTI